MLITKLVVATLIAVQAQAAELLPAPTGPLKTGRMSFHWTNPAQDEIETKAPDDKRELMVHIFYPADPDASGERAVYVPDADNMLGPWNAEQMERIKSIRAYSIESAPLAPGDAKYPVVIFSPGGGMKGLTYHVFLEDLASHGWVVVATDPTFNARAVQFPDGRVLGRLSPADRGFPEPKSGEDERRNYLDRIVHWCHDISFVIDKLAALNDGDGAFAKRLDLDRGVGVVGHSRGGQAAGSVRIFDDRVRGGINIDGMVGQHVILPVKGGEDFGKQPFLWIQKPIPAPPSDEQLAKVNRTRAEYDAQVEMILGEWKKQLDTVTGGAMRIHIYRPDIDHIDFSDEHFWDGTMTDENRPGRLQTIADTRAWIRAFFDGCVRGEWAPLQRLADANAEHIAVVKYGQMWP